MVVVEEKEDIMNMVRMTAVRMVEEKKDGRNFWYDELGEGEEGGEEAGSGEAEWW